MHFYSTRNDVLGCNIQVPHYRIIYRHMPVTAIGAKCKRAVRAQNEVQNCCTERISKTPN